jgi:tripartite-type tricarboxylate transporter receptor subunit TctC
MRGLRGVLALAVLVVLGQGRTLADDYPTKPIRIVVPFSAGGPADQRSRQVAERLTKALGQPVVVENRPGSSGAIGAGVVARAPGDGYTLLWGTIYDLAVIPAVNPSPGYDATRDFTPITQAVSAYLVLDAAPRLGVRSMKDLIALARAKPGQITCGSAGNATAAHFVLEILKGSANMQITHVAYKGDAPLLADLLGGHLDIAFTVTTSAWPHIKAGKLVPLAVTSPKRLTAFPDVPTVSELGFPEMEVTLWGGFLAAAGTPAAIVKRLNTELLKILNSPDIREQWAAGGAQADPTTPEAFAAFIQAEQARWAKVIKQTGVKME